MVSHQVNRIKDGARETFERPVEIVKEYPLSSMMIVFGMGLGVGVVLSQTLCSSLMEAIEPEPTMTEKLRKQVYDAVSHVLSPSMMRQFQHYTS
jgi:hypothetical protein